MSNSTLFGEGSYFGHKRFEGFVFNDETSLDYVINVMEDKTYGKFLFGIGAGLRYEFGKLYVEPKLTWGYPFMLSINAAVGYSF